MSGLACRIKCPKFRIGKRPTSELSCGSLFRLRHLFGFDAQLFHSREPVSLSHESLRAASIALSSSSP
jgi:hypothetical protein